MSSSPAALDPVVLGLIDGDRVLDLGCGFGKWGTLCKACWFDTAHHRATERMAPALVVGLDRHRPNLARLRGRDEYHGLAQGDAFRLPFADRSFAVVLASELIEHLTGDEGEQLLREAQRVARRSVIITTPQYPEKRAGDANPHEWHRSIWTIEHLRARGFMVHGVGCQVPYFAPDFPGAVRYPLWARPYYRLYRWLRDRRGHDLNALVARLGGNFCFHHPRWGSYLVAVKRLPA
ncbi:MAG TPA: class I SAM-dependent methyltransferase [bacterium]|nr:class I SAM-dependent methyltransferase [bacterium]